MTWRLIFVTRSSVTSRPRNLSQWRASSTLRSSGISGFQGTHMAQRSGRSQPVGSVPCVVDTPESALISYPGHMSKLLRVNQADAAPFSATTMTRAELNETDHLEAWIVSNPQVLDPGLKVITTQFNRWASAKERIDVLGLSQGGELVVIELKRDSDKLVHLQALTYAALSSGFTYDLLADAHVDWINSRHPGAAPVTKEDALKSFKEHTDVADEDFSIHDTFPSPRIILVAASFPSQVMTTVQWLSTEAPNISIECHEFDLYQSTLEGDDGASDYIVSFNRLFPVQDLDRTRLVPQARSSLDSKSTKSTTRKSRTVFRLRDTNAIPHGELIIYNPSAIIDVEEKSILDEWREANPEFQHITWDTESERSSPLVVEGAKQRNWTPHGLSDHMLGQAGIDHPKSYAAPRLFFYKGEGLGDLANRVDR